MEDCRDGSHPKERIVKHGNGLWRAQKDVIGEHLPETVIDTAADPQPWHPNLGPGQPSTAGSVSGDFEQANIIAIERTTEQAGREIEGTKKRAEETERHVAELELRALEALQRAAKAEQRALTAEWENGLVALRTEEAERRANIAREVADKAHTAKEAAGKARFEHAEQSRKTLAPAKQWSAQKAQEILATTGRAKAAERNSAEMEKWAQQRIHEAAEARAAALEHAEAARREKDMAVKHAAEAGQNKALFEERARRAKQDMREAVELAKDSAYHAQKAERDLNGPETQRRNS
ncbi:hypothetical protein QBC44DRAFT_403374 [Cladorrhinum sp. PSN332]|nr:hypothetical protein QBC44DRAFT_403374 [Cladorrhinum sp. PSN332]